MIYCTYCEAELPDNSWKVWKWHILDAHADDEELVEAVQGEGGYMVTKIGRDE